MASDQEGGHDDRPRFNFDLPENTINSIVEWFVTQPANLADFDNLPIPQLPPSPPSPPSPQSIQLLFLPLLHNHTSSPPSSAPELVSDHGTDSEANNESEPDTESESDTDSEPDSDRGSHMSDDGYDENGYG